MKILTPVDVNVILKYLNRTPLTGIQEANEMTIVSTKLRSMLKENPDGNHNDKGRQES